jgi:hypothetical protein
MSIDRFRLRRAPCVSMLAITAVLTVSAPAGAQSPALPPPARPPKADVETARAAASATLPSARSIIDRHVKAIGGRDAILSHSSTHATGTLSIPSAGIAGTIEIVAAKPNKSVLKISLAGVGDVHEGFDGTTAWTLSPMSGPMVLEGKQLDEKRFDADYYAELHDDRRYESMTTVEQATFEGRPCYKLRLVRKGGGEDIEYYDVETGLKAGSHTTRETPMGTVTGTTVETGYRRFGNILQPSTIRQTVMGLQQVITLSSIEYDTVPDSAFELPVPIKALVK